MDCRLELWTKISPFSPKLLLGYFIPATEMKVEHRSERHLKHPDGIAEREGRGSCQILGSRPGLKAEVGVPSQYMFAFLFV